MRRLDLSLAAGVTLAGETSLQVAASLFWPAGDAVPQTALVCLPGGNMNRAYYDLRAADGDTSFSFAEAMTARGFLVVTIDYLGLGGSSKPADCYALLPELLTAAAANAATQVLDGLRAGSLSAELPAIPALRSIGVGHSMGAMMTTLLQAATRLHAAVALLGFSTRGLPDYLPAPVRELSREQQRAQLPALARQLFVAQYPVIRSSGNGAEIYGSAKADPRGVAALKAATDCLLPVTAYLSMLPGNVAPEAEQIEVPVFLGLGTRDMAGPPHAIPAAFPKSLDVTLHLLPETGHSHFLFPTRARLYDRLAHWAHSVLA
ncbi:alpha/beta hydrolase [Arenimonas sp.]|uniref:alpha/beta hydrolase n=1 Tax=Arenimonas sp. TaxID=1872635 RepID=UPI002E31C813|nr:alpha/beta hydrolase [Arenimonas sp.]HEX4852593.1 alpha/beta hydrolase [Arenimonas sp.]